MKWWAWLILAWILLSVAGLVVYGVLYTKTLEVAEKNRMAPPEFSSSAPEAPAPVIRVTPVNPWAKRSAGLSI